MPLETTGEPGVLDFHSVLFVMLKGQQRITCHAEADAIEDIEASAAPDGLERLAIFGGATVRLSRRSPAAFGMRGVNPG